jgi:hypothetical protein
MRNVVVIGMHRSGTSAVTNALRLLGLNLGKTSDLVPPLQGNPGGNWEHSRLIRLNESILESYGGSWHTPPTLPEDWFRSVEARAMIPALRSEFRDIYPPRGWLWKDPRSSLTLPLWLAVWDSAPVVVMVYRHPVAVGRSLKARNGFTVSRSLTLWEHYNRCALNNTRRLPTLLRNYDDAFADPVKFVQGLRDDLVALGVVPTASAPDAASAFEPAWRRSSAAPRDLALLSRPQLQLWEQLTKPARPGR